MVFHENIFNQYDKEKYFIFFYLTNKYLWNLSTEPPDLDIERNKTQIYFIVDIFS